MKLLIIGHSVEDHFKEEGKPEIIKPGGIYYTAAALSTVKEPDEDFYLISSIEVADYNLFNGIYENFRADYLNKVEKLPKVHLKLYKDKEREEVYENITGNLKLTVNDYNIFDGVLINMITGYDVILEEIKSIRENYKGLIYFDVHTLARGLDEQGKREFRVIPEFAGWNKNIDILQVNENEVYTLYGEKEELKNAEEVLKYSKIFIVTKGEKGARAYFKINGEVSSCFKKALKTQSKSSIGCGDVFGALFFYSYIKNNDINKSLEIANFAAGYAASKNDILEFTKLRRDVFARYY